MCFLLDANMPRSAVGAIQRLGHKAVDARDAALGGAGDAQINAERPLQTPLQVAPPAHKKNRKINPSEIAPLIGFICIRADLAMILPPTKRIRRHHVHSPRNRFTLSLQPDSPAVLKAYLCRPSSLRNACVPIFLPEYGKHLVSPPVYGRVMLILAPGPATRNQSEEQRPFLLPPRLLVPGNSRPRASKNRG